MQNEQGDPYSPHVAADVQDNLDAKIVQLNASFEAFGSVIDFLSDIPPFLNFETHVLAAAIRAQLRDTHHLAAISGDQMIGYAGWLLTTSEEAEAWSNGHGILRAHSDDGVDAAALTIFAATDPSVVRRLIRGAREINPNKRVFFKRDATVSNFNPRKASVLNRVHRKGDV